MAHPDFSRVGGCPPCPPRAGAHGVGILFCPVEYIKVVSRELIRMLDGYQVVSPGMNKCDILISSTISIVNLTDNFSISTEVFSPGKVIIQSNQKDIIENFILQHKDYCIMVYTDGSVYSGTTGCGACSAILYSPVADAAILYDSRAVGKMVSSSECEVGGILLGMETALKYLDKQSTIPRDRYESELFVFTMMLYPTGEFTTAVSTLVIHQRDVYAAVFTTDDFTGRIRSTTTTTTTTGSRSECLYEQS